MTGIEVNALALRPAGSGVQTYIRELLAELPAACPTTITAHVQADAVPELPAAVRPIRHPVAAGARRALLGLCLSAREGGVFHGLDADLPLRTPAPAVTTIHDLSVFDVPGMHPRRRAAGERLLVGRAIRRADAVVAVSEFTAERVRSRFGRDAAVTPLAPRRGLHPPDAAERERIRAAYRLPERCVLQVASIEPRKDVQGLAAACAELGVPLLLAGALAPGARVPPTARHLGYVRDADLAGLYGAATVVAYCSRYEGFGLPAVEALACGAALVTTTVGGIPEVCGEAAEVVPAGSHEALTAGLRRLLEDAEYREHLRSSGPSRAALLSWRRTAELTAEVYRSLGAAW